ncbi:hypothetical protein [Marinobacter sp.]|uniref:hypothetical protein n=1 Tax=Marinobacter sp. TaxID=50741 RepID=UPI00384CFD08
MKDAHQRFRALTVALMLLLTASFTVKAQETELLSNLHDFRVNNFVALSAYYQFSATRATDVLNEVVAGINNANASLNAVTESEAGVFTDEQLATLTAQFDSFKALMRQNINDVRESGYPDLRLVSEMANQAQVLSDVSSDLYAIGRESLTSVTNPRIEAARQAAVLMARMMSKYSARSYSSVSQTFQGSDTEAALDEQALAFDALIDTLSAGDGNDEVKQVIDGVATKWMFIRGSYINFNEDNVPFIIDRYSKGILEGLEQAIAMLRTNA